MPDVTDYRHTVIALQFPLLTELTPGTVNAIAHALTLARREDPELTAPQLLAQLLQLGILARLDDSIAGRAKRAAAAIILDPQYHG